MGKLKHQKRQKKSKSRVIKTSAEKLMWSSLLSSIAKTNFKVQCCKDNPVKFSYPVADEFHV